MVDLRFNREWEYYLACSHQYVVVVVDGRGTGFKGRALRNVVKGNIGFFETQDQINAAKCVLFMFIFDVRKGSRILDSDAVSALSPSPTHSPVLPFSPFRRFFQSYCMMLNAFVGPGPPRIMSIRKESVYGAGCVFRVRCELRDGADA